MMKRVAILGCGPAGLMAAHACRLNGVGFAIFSRKEKSRLGGAQYLHAPIPGVNVYAPDAEVRHVVTGDPWVYRTKVGYQPGVNISFNEVFDGQVIQAWNLLRTYDNLWDQLGDLVQPALADVRLVREKLSQYDLILNTVPLPEICAQRITHNRGHRFRYQAIIIHPGLEEECPPNTIWYDGTEGREWYRMSHLFGVGGTEYGNGSAIPPFERLVTARKPVSHTCSCWAGQDRMVLLGRYGKWEKGVLTHHAFNEAMDALEKL